MENDSLSEIINSSIDAIDNSSDLHGVCPAHSSLSTGVKTLLLCQKSILSERKSNRAEKIKTHWQTIGIAVAVAGVVATVIGMLL